MRIGREMRKAVQNSVLWERYKAERLIKAEGGQMIDIPVVLTLGSVAYGEAPNRWSPTRRAVRQWLSFRGEIGVGLRSSSSTEGIGASLGKTPIRSVWENSLNSHRRERDGSGDAPGRTLTLVHPAPSNCSNLRASRSLSGNRRRAVADGSVLPQSSLDRARKMQFEEPRQT